MDMKALSSHFTTMHAQKGEYLFHEGGDVRGLFIICEGEVKITKSVDTKKAKQLYRREFAETPSKFISLCLLRTPSILYDRLERYQNSAVVESPSATLLYLSKKHLGRLEVHKKNSIQSLIHVHEQWRVDQQRNLQPFITRMKNQILQKRQEGEIKEYLRLPEKTNANPNITPQSCKSRVTQQRTKLSSLNFMEAIAPLEEHLVKEEEEQRCSFRTPFPSSHRQVKNTMDVHERAVMLGLGQMCISMKEKLRKERQNQAVFDKEVHRLTCHIRSDETVSSPSHRLFAAQKHSEPDIQSPTDSNWFHLSPRVQNSHRRLKTQGSRVCIQSNRWMRVLKKI